MNDFGVSFSYLQLKTCFLCSVDSHALNERTQKLADPYWQARKESKRDDVDGPQIYKTSNLLLDTTLITTKLYYPNVDLTRLKTA